MHSTRLIFSSVVIALAASVGTAGAVLLSDDHIADVDVVNTGFVNGNYLLNGSPVGYHYEILSGTTCSGFVNGSPVVVSGTSASYIAECGAFDVITTVSLLSPLPSLPTSSAGYESEYVFNNATGVDQPLGLLRYMDPDLGGNPNFSSNTATRDPVTGALTMYDSLSNPTILMATIGTTDRPATVVSWELDSLGSLSTNFPLDNNAGPVGPTDVGLDLGFEVTVPAGESVTVRYRTLYARNVAAIPADFDMSSCYTTPVPCLTAAKGQLALKDSADNAKDQLKWKFSSGEATTQADFGNPTTNSDYSLCVYNSTSDQLTSLHVPASNAVWSAVSDKGYKFKDDTGASAGITKAQLKGGVDGKSKIGIGGKGVNLPDPTLGSITLPVKVQFHSGGNAGWCWESTLGTELKNDTEQLKLKTP